MKHLHKFYNYVDLPRVKLAWDLYYRISLALLDLERFLLGEGTAYLAHFPPFGSVISSKVIPSCYGKKNGEMFRCKRLDHISFLLLKMSSFP
jgi:hypothetical protein